MEEFSEMSSALEILQSELEHAKNISQVYKKRAQDAEAAISRNQFVLVLIDGDDYLFNDNFLKAFKEGGGAAAGHELKSEVYKYLKTSGVVETNEDLQIVVNIYADRRALCTTLRLAGLVPQHNHFDQFFWSFTRSNGLFQFIDCGRGKCKTNAKFRDAFHFYSFNLQCRHILLACYHEAECILELLKDSRDSKIRQKTTIIQAPGTRHCSEAYSILQVSMVRFDSVFGDCTMERDLHRKGGSKTNSALTDVHENSQSRYSSAKTPEQIFSTIVKSAESLVPCPSNNTHPVQLAASKTSQDPTEASEVVGVVTVQPETHTPNESTSAIPVNRLGQRIDPYLKQPSSTENARLNARCKNRRLCHQHQLGKSCTVKGCKYDHEMMDLDLKNTLIYVARGIPCSSGMKCRVLDCYHGHHHPTAYDCSNPYCRFLAKGLHSVTDLEVCKFVSAEPPLPSSYCNGKCLVRRSDSIKQDDQLHWRREPKNQSLQVSNSSLTSPSIVAESTT